MANTLPMPKLLAGIFQIMRIKSLLQCTLLPARHKEKCVKIKQNRTIIKCRNQASSYNLHTRIGISVSGLDLCNKGLITKTLSSNLLSATIGRRTICTSVICHTNKKWCTGKPFENPIQDLQQYMLVPVLDPRDYIFKPTEAEIKVGQKFFQPQNGQLTQPNRGVVDLNELPPAKLPEVCFIGRSNVGKSSLIKELFYNPSNVKISISSKPGHTRSLKFYSIAKSFSLVDMPGYGYNMPEYFVQSVEEYIKTRSTLQRVFLLIDASVGLTKTDELGIDMLEELGKPYVAILTKIDKNGHHKIMTNFLQFNKTKSKYMLGCFPQPFLVSAHLGAGLPLLRAFIAHITGNLKVEGK